MKIRIREQHSALGEAFRVQRLAWLRLSFGVVMFLVGVIGFTFLETVFAGVTDPNPTIRVRVDNYTQASPAILAMAEREAGRILGEAGLRTAWLNCPLGHSISVPQDPCQERLEATDIVLRVLPEPTQNQFPETVFGFAVVPVLASVYYEYAVRRAKSDDAEFEVPIILGCVIAHEVGHLLLGSNSHSGSGVMQRRWERKQIRQAMTSTLLFTPEQAKLIQAEMQRRIRLGGVSLDLRDAKTCTSPVSMRAIVADLQQKISPARPGLRRAIGGVSLFPAL